MDQGHPIDNRMVKFVVSCCVVSKQDEVSTILISVDSTGPLATRWYLSGVCVLCSSRDISVFHVSSRKIR